MLQRSSAWMVWSMGVLLLALACGGGSSSGDGSNPHVTPPPSATAPSITAQPQDISVVVGDTATFDVVATGTAPLSYQWKKNDGDIPGATSSSYTTQATVMNDNNVTFKVTVSNGAGSITSQSATLTVTATAVGPTITAQPAGQSASEGQTATFSVTATGTAPLGYQWIKNGVAINGATSREYTTPALVAANDGDKFKVIVTNSISSVTSDEATLTVTAATVAWDPHITVNDDGQQWWLSISVDSSAVQMSLQWDGAWYGMSKEGWGTVDRPIYSVSMDIPEGAMLVLKAVALDGRTATTQPFAFQYGTIFTPPLASSTPAPLAPPASLTATAGDGQVVLSWTASAGATGYRVKRSTKSGGTYTQIGTPTDTSFTDTGLTNHTTYYYVVSAAKTGEESVNSYQVSARPLPPGALVITSQPMGQAVNIGQAATFTVVAKGAGTLTYQWQKNEVDIPSATSSSYTTSATTMQDNGSGFSVKVDNGLENITSETAVLAVIDPSGPSIPAGLIDPDTTTTWNPGILSDTELHLPLGGDRLPVRTSLYTVLSPGDDINAAIQSCPAGQVVQLTAGTFVVSSTVQLADGVVLRGMGSQGASQGGTTIVKSGGGSVVWIGNSQDGACYDWGSYAEAPCPLTSNAMKESTVVSVGSNASKFKTGDFAIIDQIDDASIVIGDGKYFKRVDNDEDDDPNNPDTYLNNLYRSISQRVEIASVDTANGTVTLTTPLHFTFKYASPYLAQLTRVTADIIKWAGIESVLLQGGTAGSYNGQSAGGIDISNAGYCWVKDVQTDGTIGGIHVALRGTYRCVVRDSYFHHSADYGFGKDCYGVVVGCASADNLIENNIARWMNKPLQLSNSGGGNVLGYNYADNAWSDQDGSFQEVPIDAHCAFPHMELIEGNWAPHMALPDTHGASGYITFFRNYASSQFAYPAVYGDTAQQAGDVQALSMCTNCINNTAVGNVLGPVAGSDPRSAVTLTDYITTGMGNGILCFGESTSTPAFNTAWIHGNYDTVNLQVMWDPGISQHQLPQSFYLTGKPGWWPAGLEWPWTGSDLNTMVGTLPAKARSDAMP